MSDPSRRYETADDRRKGLLAKIQYALETDNVLSREEVIDDWSDVLLTNVIVPILEYLQMILGGSLDAAIEMTPSSYYGFTIRHLSKELLPFHEAAFNLVIEALKEWRG